MSAALMAWLTSHLRAGELGIFGDFLYSINQTRYGSGPAETLMGPAILPLLEMGVIHPLNAVKGRIEGKDTHLLAQEIRNLKGFVPFMNVWYTKAATEHLVWQRVMEMASPGYVNMIRSNTAKDFGQAWWWNPGETKPHRGPDLGAAIK